MIKKDDTTLWRNEEHTRISNCFNTNDHGYVLLVENTSWSFPHSWLITGIVASVTGWVTVVKQELLTIPELCRGRVSRSLVLWVCFVNRCLSFCPFSFCHCGVCPSSIYGFWLTLGIFKLFLKRVIINQKYNPQENEESKSHSMQGVICLFFYFCLSSYSDPYRAS
jgi:hypothetical protein